MQQRQIQCQGRFSELRNEISEALKIVELPLKQKSLEDIFDLVNSDKLYQFDIPDGYFDARYDNLRPTPLINYESLIPLIARKTELPTDAVALYLNSFANIQDTKVIRVLSEFNRQINLNQLLSSSHKEYYLCANFGIGNRDKEIIVSDSPFNIELWLPASGKMKKRHAGSIGFWYQQKDGLELFIIDQIQAARTGSPEFITGELALKTICEIGKSIGVNEIRTYSAQKHPMFKKHPERKTQFLSAFTKIYDDSAIACGFNGNKQTGYVKRL